MKLVADLSLAQAHPLRSGAAGETTRDAIDTGTLTPESDPLVEVILEAESYRVVAQQAIHYCRALHEELHGLRQRYRQLDDEYRALRQRVMRSSER